MMNSVQLSYDFFVIFIVKKSYSAVLSALFIGQIFCNSPTLAKIVIPAKLVLAQEGSGNPEEMVIFIN